MEKLHTFILKDNKRLVKLLKWIQAMKSLTILDVGGCDLDCLPQGMGQLEKLYMLTLKDNKRLVAPPNCIEGNEVINMA